MRTTVQALIVLLASPVPGVGAGPEGTWETHDDRTGARRATVHIFLRDDQLAGVIARVFARPGEPPAPVCSRCRGSLRNRPVLGLEILRGHRRQGERWEGGSILDPENGKEYRSALWLEGPERLRVRGYWGPFHRTQTWQRSKPDGAGAGASEPRP